MTRIFLMTILVVVLLPLGHGAGAAAAQADAPPIRLFDAFSKVNRIDELVLLELMKRKLPPSERCRDEVYIRRVFLDAIGTLPTSGEIRAFLADPASNKRIRLVEALLERSEFADYWALKWGDLLRVKSEFPSNLWPNAVQAYHHWIRTCIRDNIPYDRFARELLTASGSNFRSPPVNFFRAFQERLPLSIAENVALIFMGVRLSDAGFSQDQICGFAAFFAKLGYKMTDEWKEEIVFVDTDPKPAETTGEKSEKEIKEAQEAKPLIPMFPGGKALTLAPDQDPRCVFADWLTAPGNPWFARCMANRVWYWLMGRGLVHEPEDMKPGNLAWSPELLTYLERELAGNKFNVRHLFKLILTSATYQLSSQTNRWNQADETGCSHYRIRRIDAEPLVDAICLITGVGEKYTSAIPEPFTFLPADQRAIALADGSIESPFLELFGRPPRNTSYESERVSTPSVFQSQYLLNSSQVQRKIEQSKTLQQLATSKQKPLEELYLRVLSRFPTDEERRAIQAYMADPKRKPAASFYDVVWALINSKEFILKH